jgi:cytochrome c oxidase cbb3-type subunit III
VTLAPGYFALQAGPTATGGMKERNYRAKVVGLCCLAVVAACWIHVSAKAQKKRTTPAAETSQGARLFPANCGSCHGLDGRGGERAPDIAGRREIQKLSDGALAKIIRDGITGTGMPPFRALGNVKIQALVRHLRTLQGETLESSLPGSAARGKSLFFGKAGCAECHMVNGSGGFIASDLSAYGRAKAVAQIRSAIVNPLETSQERGRIVVVTTNDGQTFTGIARNEDNFSLQLQTKDGGFHFFEKSSLRALEHRAESLMPSDYAIRLSTQEVDDVISYLMSVARSTQPNKQLDRKPGTSEEGQE